MNETHALYRFYSDSGQLLYIGLTSNPGNRFQQHQQDKPWWHEVAGIAVEKYESREAVKAAETRAIAVEKPKYNVQRPSLPSQRSARAAAPAPTLPTLVWICETCHKPVDNGTGYLHVDLKETGIRERAYAEWERRHTDEDGNTTIQGSAWTELFDLPERAPWQAHHAACDPDPEAGDYWFSIERARTHADLLRWTAHLMEKTWLEATDWQELIDRMAGVRS